MKKGRYILLLALFFIVLVLAAAVSFFVFEIGRTPAIPASAYLEIRLVGPLLEYPELSFFSSFFPGGHGMSVHDIWMSLRKAAVDPRIAAVLLRLGALDCDWAKCAELRDAVLEFRASGKKAYAAIEEAPQFTKEYYLATACDRIILHPLGWLGIPGIGGQVPFFKNALDRLGIQVDVQHIEEYKTAYSQFTETGFTPAHREMTEALLADQFAQFVRTVAEARGKTEAEVRDLVDTAFFQGEEAVRAGLVDDLLYEDQIVSLIERGGRKVERTPLADYARIAPSAVGLGRGRRMALIYGSGPIHEGESGPGSMGAETIARAFRAARRDASLVAVVFRVDSPGGSAVASDVIWREIELCKKTKPVVVSMSDLAGSGGYWVAMGASKIVAQPQTLTGSIGVLTGKVNLAPLLEKLGITTETVRFGARSDLFTPFRGWTDEERKLLKKEIRWIYDRFVAKAAEGRKLSMDSVEKIARGRVWTGAQAKALGLVDELGGLSTAIALAKQLAGLPKTEDVDLVVWPKRAGFWKILFGLRDSDAQTALPRELGRVLELARVLDQDRVWALMPLWIGF